MGTGNEQKIQIQGGSGLSDDEVNQMIRDAESHADDDKRLKDLAEARNTAEQVIYSTEKSLTEHESKLDEETRSDIRSKIDAAKMALEGEDAADIRSKLEALREASFKLGELVYQQAQSEAQPQGGEAPADEEPAEEEIVDAEVVDEEAGDRA
jgi:molecular chaperone DnaK